MARRRKPRSAIRMRRAVVKKPPSPLVRKFLISLIISLVIIISGLVLYDVMSRDLPLLEVLENFDPNLITRLYSADSVLIQEFFAQRRVLVPLREMPSHLIDAFIVTEDKRFREHWGISLRDIVRALGVDILTLSKRQGASTITQQLARILYLNREKRITRKIKEAITALQIERTYTKDEILEMYLNMYDLGHGAFGVQAASKRYFDKNVQELTLDESAMLAALPRGPGRYSPINHPDRALERRNLVLSLMYKAGYITNLERIKAQNTPLKVKISMEIGGFAPYFTEYVRQQVNREAGKIDVDILHDGLTIYTTLDSRIQEAAERAIKIHIDGVRAEDDSTTPDYLLGQQGVLNKRFLEAPEEIISLIDTSVYPVVEVDSMLRGEKEMPDVLRKKFIVQTALISVDPSNGHILAMIGGRDFTKDKFNSAVQAKRQPGSAFKPFVWATVIDNGVPVTTRVLNQPVVLFQDDTTKWRPRNYDGSTGGLTDLRTALMRSLNLVSVRIVQNLTTPAAVREYAVRLGLTTPIRAVDAMALGSNEVIPLEMASAYATFANKGVWVEPSAITRIEDRYGNLIKEYKPLKKEVLSEETAYIITDLLESVVKGGTGRRARSIYRFFMDAGGKTGTTNDWTDAWFVGFTPKIATAVWVGVEGPPRISLGEGQTGTMAALPIWAMFNKSVYDSLGWTDEPFERPEGVVELEICKETGLLPTPYCPITTEIFNKKYLPTETCPIHTGRTTKSKKGKVDF